MFRATLLLLLAIAPVFSGGRGVFVCLRPDGSVGIDGGGIACHNCKAAAGCGHHHGHEACNHQAGKCLHEPGYEHHDDDALPGVRLVRFDDCRCQHIPLAGEPSQVVGRTLISFDLHVASLAPVASLTASQLAAGNYFSLAAIDLRSEPTSSDILRC